MKKILLLILFLCSSQVYGQFWIDVSAKAGLGPNLLINANVFEDDELIHKFAIGNMFAGKLGLNFGDIHSLNFDVSTVSFNQSFQNKSERVLQQEFKYQSIDLAVIYRKLFEGRYVEIGPLYSITSESFFADSNMGVVAGFGRTLAASDRVSVNLGFRARYLFQDALNGGVGTESLFFGTVYETYKNSTPLSGFITLEIDWAVGVFSRSTCYRNRLRFISF